MKTIKLINKQRKVYQLIHSYLAINVSATIIDYMQKDIDSKRRKVDNGPESSKFQITHQSTQDLKISRFILASRNNSYFSIRSLNAVADLTNLACTASSKTHLYLVVDVLPNRDYIVRCRIALSRLF